MVDGDNVGSQAPGQCGRLGPRVFEESPRGDEGGVSAAARERSRRTRAVAVQRLRPSNPSALTSLTRRSRPRGSRHASRDAGVGQGGGLPVVARGRVGPGGPSRRDEGRAEDARSIQAGAGAISSHRRHRVHGAVEGAGLRRARAREERGGKKGGGFAQAVAAAKAALGMGTDARTGPA